MKRVLLALAIALGLAQAADEPPAAGESKKDFVIEMEDAKQIIKKFLKSEEARGSWVSESEEVIKDRDIWLDQESDKFIWGPWSIDRKTKTIRLVSRLFWLDGKIVKTDKNKFEVTDVEVTTVRRRP